MRILAGRHAHKPTHQTGHDAFAVADNACARLARTTSRTWIFLVAQVIIRTEPLDLHGLDHGRSRS